MASLTFGQLQKDVGEAERTAGSNGLWCDPAGLAVGTRRNVLRLRNIERGREW